MIGTMTDPKCRILKGWPWTYQERIKNLWTLAANNGWTFKEEQKNIGMISFQKIIDGFTCRINIYVTTMSVTTYIKHPKKGKGQLYRKFVNRKLMKMIFKNPRQHTGIGYYTKNKKK